MERKLTKRIQVGPVAVGGGAPVSIQSMLNTRTTDVEGSLAQIRALAAAASWSNSQYENAENAAAYCRQVYDAGYSPICPVLFLPTFLKDEIPQEHKDGLDMARDYLRRSHVLVVCGHR